MPFIIPEDGNNKILIVDVSSFFFNILPCIVFLTLYCIFDLALYFRTI